MKVLEAIAAERGERTARSRPDARVPVPVCSPPTAVCPGGLLLRLQQVWRGQTDWYVQ